MHSKQVDSFTFQLIDVTLMDTIKLSHLKVGFPNRIHPGVRKKALVIVEEEREWVLSKDAANTLI